MPEPDKRFTQLNRDAVLDRMSELALNVEPLAESVGVDTSTLSRWIRGEQKIRHANARALAVALGCDVEDLLLRNGQEASHAGPELLPARNIRARFRQNLERWLDKAIVEQLNTIQPAAYNVLESSISQVIRHGAFVGRPAAQQIPTRDGGVISAIHRSGSPDPALMQHLCGPHPLRVLIPISSTAALAMFRFMKIVRGAGIELDYWNIRGADVVDKLMQTASQAQADLFVLGPAPTAHLLTVGGKPVFHAIAPLPAIRNCVVAPSRLKDQRDWNILKSGEYLISTEEAANQLWCFLNVVNGDGRAATATPTPLAGVPEAFQSGEKSLRSILWSPLAEILRALGVVRILSDSVSRDGSGSICQLLFAGPDLRLEVARSLCAALIDAWKSLRSPDYRALVVRSLMADPLFVETFERSTGIDALY